MKWFSRTNILSLLLLVTSCVDAALEEDWIFETPITVYETRPIRTQNMDFDFSNNMFLAHSGWYNDKRIHYYRFRMFTPDEYPGLISDTSTSADVPIQKLYIVTTDGSLSGAIGKPIISHHSIEGNAYSDFMEIYLVIAPSDYEEDLYRSEGDVLSSGQPAGPSGIIVNMPVVPFESKLQYPGQSGTRRAPIDPVEVWYRGVDVQTFVFEVTDQLAATHFAYTRTKPEEPGFDITVTSYANADLQRVSSIPLWHINQYTNGVEEGVNAGGPSPFGMRNIISLDRGDAGYSPLWKVEWVTHVPVDFSADDVSHVDDLSLANGFRIASAPMFVNCPNVGIVGTIENRNKKTSHLTVVSTTKQQSLIAGSPVSTIMQQGLPVSFQTGAGDSLGFGETTDMGAYIFQARTSVFPPGTTSIEVLIGGELVRQVAVRDYIAEPPLTVYEQDGVTFENLDYDKENKLFMAHSTWYNDRETWTYKFRIYSPDTYPSNIIAGEATAADVPLQKLYIITQGGVDGAIGRPVLQAHHSDGEIYSDFMELILVTVNKDEYIADSFRSEGDILLSSARILATGIIVNAPLVPIGSGLQDPARRGIRRLPIQPLTAWYKGVEVWTFLFETSDTLTANYFAWTRQDPRDLSYRITSTPFTDLQGKVTSVPVYHMNQYKRGVSEENNNFGGPDPMGMRNIVTSDRPDVGYSPLRQIYWVTKLPMNYEADQVSHIDEFDESQGFGFSETPYFVNAPGIGQTRQQINPNRKTTGFWRTTIDPRLVSTVILGSDPSLIFQEGIPVQFLTVSGATIGQAFTNRMGGYEFQLNTIAIPSSSQTAISVNVDGITTRTLPIGIQTDPNATDTVSGSRPVVVAAMPLLTLAASFAMFF